MYVFNIYTSLSLFFFVRWMLGYCILVTFLFQSDFAGVFLNNLMLEIKQGPVKIALIGPKPSEIAAFTAEFTAYFNMQQVHKDPPFVWITHKILCVIGVFLCIICVIKIPIMLLYNSTQYSSI